MTIVIRQSITQKMNLNTIRFIITRNIMTHQPNKQFNTYKEGLDLEFLREYCKDCGERRTFERDEVLEDAGEPAQWVAFMERGCFKYVMRGYSKADT